MSYFLSQYQNVTLPLAGKAYSSILKVVVQHTPPVSSTKLASSYSHERCLGLARNELARACRTMHDTDLFLMQSDYSWLQLVYVDGAKVCAGHECYADFVCQADYGWHSETAVPATEQTDHNRSCHK
jgi:hypothetical protein